MQQACGLVISDSNFCLKQDIAGIDSVLQLKGAYAYFVFTIDDCPIDGCSLPDNLATKMHVR